MRETPHSWESYSCETGTPITAMERLKREAEQACQNRGHTMAQWKPDGYWKDRESCECERCGKGVQVCLRPPANGIDIGGEAVALGCV